MILLPIIAAAIFAPGANAPAPAADVSAATKAAIAWGRSELHLSGWRLVSASPALLILIKPGASRPGENPQVLMRGEHVAIAAGNPLGSGESFVNVSEIACAKSLERVLHATVYAGSDLQGAILVGSDDPSPWNKITSASLWVSAQSSVCRNASLTTQPSAAAPAPLTPKP